MPLSLSYEQKFMIRCIYDLPFLQICEQLEQQLRHRHYGASDIFVIGYCVGAVFNYRRRFIYTIQYKDKLIRIMIPANRTIGYLATDL